MTEPFGVDGILERPRALDEELELEYGGARRFELVLSGGSAVSVQGLMNSRYTTDIDLLRVPKEAYSIMGRHGMNDDVGTFLYMYPTHWHDRIQPVRGFQGNILDAYALSPEDLAITKLLAWREKDREDLESMWLDGSVNRSRLDAILQDPLELRVNIDEDQWQSLIQRVALLDSNTYESSFPTYHMGPWDGPDNPGTGMDDAGEDPADTGMIL